MHSVLYNKSQNQKFAIKKGKTLGMNWLMEYNCVSLFTHSYVFMMATTFPISCSQKKENCQYTSVIECLNKIFPSCIWTGEKNIKNNSGAVLGKYHPHVILRHCQIKCCNKRQIAAVLQQ